MKPLTDATARLLRPLSYVKENECIHLSLQKNNFLLHHFSMHKSVNGEIEKRYPYSSQIRHRFPELKQVQTGNPHGAYYEAPISDYTVEILNAIWPKDQLTLTPEARAFYNAMLLQGAKDEKSAEYVANYKSSGVLPSALLGLDCDLLRKHQKIGLINSYQNPAYALFMKQGTGKTAIAVSRICNEARFYKPERMYRALIVCPYAVCENWVNEFHKFGTTDGRVTVIRGTKAKRMQLLAEAFVPVNGSKFTAVIVSYDTLTVDFDDYIQYIEWDLSVLDESHYIKSIKAKRTKTCLELSERCRQRMILTGTPTTNNYFELYPQWEYLQKGLSGFSSFEKFKRFFGEFYMDAASGHSVFSGYQNMPLMQEKLARKSFVITKKEALPDLPDKMYRILSCDMSKDQMKWYDKVASDILIESENATSTLEVNNILTKMLRLAEITSGYISWDPVRDDEGNILRPKIIDRFDPNPKLELLVSILKEKKAESPQSKTIVWTCWTQNIKTIAARLRLEGIGCVTYYGQTSKHKREKAVQSFNTDSATTVFIGNSAAGGTGLNLLGYDPLHPDDYETNCDEKVYYSQNWSMVHREQSEDRAHRMGTRVPIQITDLVVPDSIDQQIRERVVEKRTSSYQLADLRVIMEVLRTKCVST